MAGIIGPVHLGDPDSPVGIPREWKGQGEPPGSRYYEAYQQLEQAADLILAKHQEFVRAARAQLDE